MNAKTNYTDQSILQTYLLCLKRNVSQTFKSCKKSFPSVYIINTFYFNRCFLLVLIIASHYFYANLSLPSGLVQPPCFDTSVLKEVRILYPLSLPKNCNAANTKTKVQNKFLLLKCSQPYSHSMALSPSK